MRIEGATLAVLYRNMQLNIGHRFEFVLATGKPLFSNTRSVLFSILFH